MDRAIAGAHATNELDFVGWDHFSTRQAFLARTTSGRHDLNGKVRRGHNAMTERRMQSDCGFEQEVGGTLSQLKPIRNITTFVEIQFQPEKSYRSSLDCGPGNGVNVGDLN